ncbi:alpha-E domain-containing protein, partial [Achromobacter xylosoxidans]
RADNTARMLDVKFHERDGDGNGNGTPQQQQGGRGEGHASGALQSEFYRWSALLSSVSGLEIYRKVYRDVIT